MTKQIIFFVGISTAALFFFNILAHHLEHVEIVPVSVWWAIPFIFLLCSIAVGPFINRHWWENHYPKVSLGLGMIVVFYYAFSLDNVPRLFLVFYEYISFISLIGSLFVVAGGIHIRLRGKSRPWENVLLLGSGAVISNVLGTTGASMLFLRPYLRVNRYRIKGYHVIFFIFVVSNIGGALTPIGDPPLFLGYLKGIPFFWLVDKAWYIWAFTVGIVLLVFFLVDNYYFHKETTREQLRAHIPDEPEISGLHNTVFLMIILGAVFIEKPVLVREILMWSAALASYRTTKHEVHRKNDFNFIPIKEVVILFAGIFATMIPALDWLQLNARILGIVTPGQYFWGTGVLSGFLDNAPTYLNFLTAAFSVHGANVDNIQHLQLMIGISTPEELGVVNPLHAGAVPITSETWRYVQAISLGAVFFGACTYIGNGPNFMVKSISEHSGVQCPSFFGYILRYSIPILIPIFAIVWYLFFR